MSVNPEKVIIMAKLSLYDRGEGERDRKKREFFRHDYVYKQNAKLRRGAAFAGVFIYLLRFMHRAASGEVFDLYTFDYMAELRGLAIFLIALMVAVSVVGTLIYNVDYEKSLKRLEDYNRLLDAINEIELEEDE